MIAFDTTFLVDYLDEEPAAREFIESERRGAYFSPTPALFEVYRGGAQTAGAGGMEEVASALSWVEPLPLTDPAVQEAALIEAELLEAGEPVNLGDILIAGTCREAGADVVTRDKHYDKVDGLDAISY